MNIAFLNPPFKGTYNREVRFQAVSPQKALHPPIMLGYATAICRDLGHKVDLIDAPALEITPEETIGRIARFGAEYVVMLTSTASVQSDGALARQLATETGAKIVAVGAHATAVPEDTLRRGFDIVARGEYDYTTRDLAEGKKLNKVEGISYKKGNRVIHNKARPLIKKLDELPFPAREFLPNEKYYSALYKNPFTFILAGRGCPHQCIYCAGPQLMSGRGHRFRSPQNVVAELKHIKENFRLKSVLFNDDTLNVNKAHLLELCNRIVEEKVDMPWAAYSRVDSADPEIARTMKKAGCFLVKVGFESGCDSLLKTMKKGPRATTEQAKKAAKCFKEAGIQVHGTFVFGMPGETQKTIRKTIEFAKELDLDFVQFSIAQPYPGTEFYRYLEKKGYLRFKEWSDYLDEEGCIAPIFEYPKLSINDMEQLLRAAYKEYYLRPSYMLKAVRQRLTNWNLFKTSLRSAWSLIHYLRG
jgi:radical SAM superfamily enzyme YgiQ (UPF0313 family)